MLNTRTLIRHVAEIVGYTIVGMFLVVVGLVIPLLALMNIDDEKIILFMLLMSGQQ